MQHKTYGPYEKYFKRPLDFIFALLAITGFGWLYIIIAILIKIKLGSPVLFAQDRPGKNERIFKLYKFRSMSNAHDENGKLLPDSERLTKFGKVLRSTSLDELPEVFNILKGDMSIVGPRPLAVKYLPYYSDIERQRHVIRPGLTGIAQTHGRNALQWEKRFAYDLKYVNRITFIEDFKILLLTIKKVLVREDIVVRGTEAALLDFDVYRKGQTNG